MKFLLTLLILFFAFDVSAQIRGTLLKSNGKPLAYTEIELVPVDSKRMVMNQNLFAISSATGKFSFQNVPPDEYTLSINFDDKPTDLSPYDTFFYPNATDRSEAEVLQINSSSAIKNVIFKLPPPLVQRKIIGNAVFTNGNPVVGAWIGLRDIKFDRSVGFGIAKTDAKGNFTVMGFSNREYQIGAVLFDRIPKPTDNFLPQVVAAGESKIFTLDATTSIIKFTLRQSEGIEKIRDKYVADLVGQENIFSD
ncbi:MAG TPA: carboxypeptidase-like regulatory domain-containing protein [Pyrinomonadaceae bacterium]|mgnify:CR=1 FL=1|nr:carboxypeptidase-like regulatory domain-containing protein [Pyrinomonadaceae bacterium]